MTIIPPERNDEAPIDDKETGLPGLRSWRAVYLFVLGVFVGWIVLLASFTRMFS